MLVVGFSVDYSAHIAHAFVHAEGTGEERATEALATIGRSVLCGGFSTWLAVALLPLSGSYFFRIVLFRSISFAVSKPLSRPAPSVMSHSRCACLKGKSHAGKTVQRRFGFSGVPRGMCPCGVGTGCAALS